jgi:hypothetical protein
MLRNLTKKKNTLVIGDWRMVICYFKKYWPKRKNSIHESSESEIFIYYSPRRPLRKIRERGRPARIPKKWDEAL